MWAMTSEQITCCGKYKDAPSEFTLRKWSVPSCGECGELIASSCRVLWDQLQCWIQGHILFQGPLANNWARQWHKGLDQWGTGQCRALLMANPCFRAPHWVDRDLVRPTVQSNGSLCRLLPVPFLFPGVIQGQPPGKPNLQHCLAAKGMIVKVDILMKVFIQENVIPYTVSTTFLCWKMNNRYLDICYLFDRFLSFWFLWHGNFRTGFPKIQH